MINLHDYKDVRKVAITDVDDEIFEGVVIELIDVGERSDLEEQEYGIVISIEGREIEFVQSEIKNIKIID